MRPSIHNFSFLQKGGLMSKSITEETATDNAVQTDIISWSNTLLEHVISVWEHGFMGIDIGKFLIALVIFSAFMLFRGLFSKYVLDKLRAWSQKTKTKADDKIVDALIAPIKFVPVILGFFFAGQYLQLDDSLSVVFGRALQSMIAFTIFWGLYRILEPLSAMSHKLDSLLTPLMAQWLFRVIKVVLVFFAGAVILEIWGIEVGPLLAGLGLFGAAIALGAQDLFKNLIGGMTIIAEKRYEAGDWIRVEGVVEGKVEDIGFRSTKVRRFDKAPVHVPNAQLSDVAVINFSRMTSRRIYWKIGVIYSTTTEQLKIIRDEILNYIVSHEGFESPDIVPTFVRIDEFNSSSIDIMVYCFTKTTAWGEWLALKEELAFEIKDIVENKAGTSFAFPSTSVYVEQLPTDSYDVAERFVSPVKSS